MPIPMRNSEISAISYFGVIANSRDPANADANAAIGKWPIYALGYASINGAAWASTQMATMEIAEPYVGLTVQRSSVEQGKETDDDHRPDRRKSHCSHDERA